MSARTAERVRIDVPTLATFAAQHHVTRLALFGSVLRDDFRPESDIDLLVEFEPDARIGLLRLAGMELELEQLLGRKVDLRTPRDLSRYFRQQRCCTNEADRVRLHHMLDAAHEAE